MEEAAEEPGQVRKHMSGRWKAAKGGDPSRDPSDLLQGDPLTFSVLLEGCKNFASHSCGAGEKRKYASWIPSFAMGHVVLLHGRVRKVLAIWEKGWEGDVGAKQKRGDFPPPSFFGGEYYKGHRRAFPQSMLARCVGLHQPFSLGCLVAVMGFVVGCIWQVAHGRERS